MPELSQLYDFLSARRAKAYLVGGALRDSLLDRGRFDIDVSVMGDAIALARDFGDRIGAALYIMDEENEVARVVVDRADGRYYVDFAAVRGATIEEDLATRDFTINAMAADISSGSWQKDDVIDPFGGRDDLDARRIRVVASSVFDNDPVRLLRAVRFEAVLGFALDPETQALVRLEARKLVDASPERARDEFFRIVSAENCARHLRRLDDLGLLTFLLPELTALKGVGQTAPHRYDVFEHALHTLEALESMQRGDYLDLAEGAFSQQLSVHFAETVSANRQRGMLLRIGTLFHDIGKPRARTVEPDGRVRFREHEQLGVELVERALRRLRFSNDEVDLLTTISREHMRPLDLAKQRQVTDADVYHYFRATGAAGVDIAVHAWCDLRARSAAAQAFEIDASLQVAIARLLDRYYHARDKIVDPPLLLNGRDIIMILAIPPGPLIGRYIEALREAEATGLVTSHEQAVAFIKNWQPNGQPEPNSTP